MCHLFQHMCATSPSYVYIYTQLEKSWQRYTWRKDSLYGFHSPKVHTYIWAGTWELSQSLRCINCSWRQCNSWTCPSNIISFVLFFLRRNGTILCQVTGRRCCSIDLQKEGWRYPVLWHSGATQYIKKLQKLVASALAKEHWASSTKERKSWYNSNNWWWSRSWGIDQSAVAEVSRLFTYGNRQSGHYFRWFIKCLGYKQCSNTALPPVSTYWMITQYCFAKEELTAKDQMWNSDYTW